MAVPEFQSLMLPKKRGLTHGAGNYLGGCIQQLHLHSFGLLLPES
jgi:hypothetical protein